MFSICSGGGGAFMGPGTFCEGEGATNCCFGENIGACCTNGTTCVYPVYSSQCVGENQEYYDEQNCNDISEEPLKPATCVTSVWTPGCIEDSPLGLVTTEFIGIYNSEFSGVILTG